MCAVTSNRASDVTASLVLIACNRHMQRRPEHTSGLSPSDCMRTSATSNGLPTKLAYEVTVVLGQGGSKGG